MQAALNDYKATTLDEKILIGQLQQLLHQHWQQMTQAMSQPSGDNQQRRSASFCGDQVLPLR
jgi:hypothetical protein